MMTKDDAKLGKTSKTRHSRQHTWLSDSLAGTKSFTTFVGELFLLRDGCACLLHAQPRAVTSTTRHRSRHAPCPVSPCVLTSRLSPGSRPAARPRPARRAVALRRSIRCDAGGDADTGAAVKDVLDGSSVFLVGMMGTGKSSVGKKLAASLGYSFFGPYVRATPLSRVGAVYPLRALSRDTKKKTRARRVCEIGASGR